MGGGGIGGMYSPNVASLLPIVYHRCVDKFTSSSVMSMNNRIILKKSKYW